MKAFAIAGANLRRLFRDRVGVFFMLVFPFMLILALGALFGSAFTPIVGVVARDADPLGRDLVERLEATAGIEVRTFEDREALTDAVERGEAEAGLVVPGGYGDDVRAGGTVAIPLIARPAGEGQQVGLTVAAVLSEQAEELRAARFVESEGLAAFDEALARARELRASVPGVDVRETVAGGEGEPGGFDYGAAQELILFVFVISLAASSMLIESRRLGVSTRMLASPTPARTILAGETLGRFAIALFEGLLIFVVTLLLFGVEWGDPAGGIGIIVLFSLVGTGAAMLMGSALHNAQQAGGLGVFIGLGFAALGGCMVPLEIFPPAMRTLAHVTPHAWAMDAFDELLREGGTLADILPELGVLAAYSAVLLAAAVALFRRRLTAAPGTA
ncbi:MAG TPA: ABC transporter permease [Actinomycetota bacterium]